MYNLRLELYKVNFLSKSETSKILTEDDFYLFFEIIEKIHKFTNKNNSKLFFVFLPQYQDFIYNNNPNQYISKKIEEKLNEMEIPFIELKNSVFLITFSLILFSIGGIPPLAGFFSKFLILLSFITKQYYVTAIVIVLISSVACFYYIRLIKTFFFVKSSKNSF